MNVHINFNQHKNMKNTIIEFLNTDLITLDFFSIPVSSNFTHDIMIYPPKNGVRVFQFVARRQSHVYSSQLFLNVFLILSPLSHKWTTAPLPYIPCVHIIVSEVVLLCSVLYVL